MLNRLEISEGQYSDKGRKESNQDFHGVMLPDGNLLKTKGIAIAIADGISSSEYGAEASEACVSGFLSDYFSTPDSWSVIKSVRQILTALNSWLYSQGHQQHDPHRGRVSTLSALVLKSTTAHVVHIGDSRIYRLREGVLKQLTTDHNIWVSKDKNYLSRAMGADTHIEIDYSKKSLEAGDIFILTTDGVHEYVADKLISSCVMDNRSNLKRAAQLLCQQALENNSPDNLTCQIIRIDQLPSRDPDEVYRELTELPFPPHLNVGMILDGFRIVREIHSSKQTQLYMAKDIDTGLHVALKTPSVNYQDDPAYIERFMLEEWVGRRIDSPHVVKVYEPTRRRRFLYQVTEFLEGRTLRQWMTDHPQPDLEDVRCHIEQLTRGVRAFHRLEMLHQDLKPENIMLDKNGTLRIVDFGSTKIAGIAEIETPIERINLLGTKNYTAPEYAHNQPGTNRSDIYSVGVMAYEMLSGQFPYGDLPENWLQQPSRLKRHYTSLLEYRADIPDWVDAAIQKAVSIDPDVRYERLSEFIYDLRHPNLSLVSSEHKPLMERNPVAVWQGISLLLFLIIIVLLMQ